MIKLSGADAALKDYYLDAVTKEIEEKSGPFFGAIAKSSADVFGKDVKVTMIKGATGSVAAGDEAGVLPDPYANRYLSVTVPLKNLYGTIEISDKAVRASADGAGAFVNLLNAEMQGLVTSARENFSRMLFGDGNGYMFRITGKVSDYVYSADAVRPSFAGMTADIRSADGSALIESDVVVRSVDAAAGTVTLDVSLSEGEDGLSVSAYAAGTYGKELTGLAAIFDSATLYGLNKAQESYLSPMKTALATALTEDALISAIDKMEELYDGKPDMILVSYAARKAIGALVADNRRVVNSSDLAVGYGEITVAGVPVYADRYCPDNTVYLLRTDDFRLCQLCDWEWMEDEDGRILRQIPGKAAYSATLVKYAELICTRPCAQCRITFTD